MIIVSNISLSSLFFFRSFVHFFFLSVSDNPNLEITFEWWMHKKSWFVFDVTNVKWFFGSIFMPFSKCYVQIQYIQNVHSQENSIWKLVIFCALWQWLLLIRLYKRYTISMYLKSWQPQAHFFALLLVTINVSKFQQTTTINSTFVSLLSFVRLLDLISLCKFSIYLLGAF